MLSSVKVVVVCAGMRGWHLVFVLQQLGVLFGAIPVSLAAAIIMKVGFRVLTCNTICQVAQMFVRPQTARLVS